METTDVCCCFSSHDCNIIRQVGRSLGTNFNKIFHDFATCSYNLSSLNPLLKTLKPSFSFLSSACFSAPNTHPKAPSGVHAISDVIENKRQSKNFLRNYRNNPVAMDMLKLCILFIFCCYPALAWESKFYENNIIFIIKFFFITQRS